MRDIDISINKLLKYKICATKQTPIFTYSKMRRIKMQNNYTTHTHMYIYIYICICMCICT